MNVSLLKTNKTIIPITIIIKIYIFNIMLRASVQCKMFSLHVLIPFAGHLEVLTSKGRINSGYLQRALFNVFHLKGFVY